MGAKGAWHVYVNVGQALDTSGAYLPPLHGLEAVLPTPLALEAHTVTSVNLWFGRKVSSLFTMTTCMNR